MKLTLITLSAISALALGSSAFANEPETGGQDQRGGRGGGGGHHHSSLERMTEQLNLTPEQKAKVQPIIDQATPQIENIRREAMQKTKTVVDNAMGQIRPLLTPEQQKKLDESQNDRRGGREGRGGRGERHGQGDQSDQGNQ
jgi:Spy/CpxP family protein refolding chaperone